MSDKYTKDEKRDLTEVASAMIEDKRKDDEERGFITSGISLDRLRELVKADAEGRVVVLPVAIGTPVYIVHCFPVIKVGDCVMEFIGKPIEEYPFVIDMLPLWGEEIFATRAEAERALANAGKEE